MSRAAISLGPNDHGRRMSLEEFEWADGQEGHLYELGRGVVTVVDVPDGKHLAQVDEIRQQLSAYRVGNPDRIHRIAGGGECKILLTELRSERHPDIAIYRDPPPAEEDLWSGWVPEIVIEVVSPGSVHRDYVEKREEYLAFGVREYWIVNAGKQEMLVLRRSGGRWVEQAMGAEDVYRTRLLQGFEFSLRAVFEAAAGA